MTIGRVRKLETQYLSVIFGLLKTVKGLFIGGLGLDDGDHEVARITEEIIGSLLWTASDLGPRDNDAPVCKGLLLGKGVRLVVPSAWTSFGRIYFLQVSASVIMTDILQPSL